ncbi:sialate O-acetylesterase [Pedobacter arcticus]|uniref:sialate O-acetylesterase n=1 Tax=Pedobacter arcticus TaxID=752140 RepID=UPI0002EB5BD5|nr:sialate O-acetylesterase [Pedobacter arcticus]
MMNKTKATLLIQFALLLSFTSLLADVKLPAIFADNMVLQQQSEVAIWGKAKANAKVKLTTSWNKESYNVTTTSDGSWKVKVATPKAGGPYQININDGKTITLKGVLIGEVWVCSGQSNMEMPMKGFRNQAVSGSAAAIAFSENPQIRLFTVKKSKSLTPLNDFDAQWSLCEPESVNNFSAVAYYYGLMLHKKLQVPIGLIQATWGGTRIEPWISEMGVKNFDWLKLPEEKPVDNLSQQTPTVLFNAMINPMVGYGIKGAIWYQGESNRKEYVEYEKLMPGLINDWRSAWNVGDFSFYYVQIAPYNYKTTTANSAYLREAQLKASTSLPNIGMASILDIGDEAFIHAPNKETVGQRLAFMALEKTYGVKGIQSGSPVLKEMKIADAKAMLTFSNAPLGLTSYGKKLLNFEIAGADQKYYPADAVLTNIGVDVSSSLVKEPVAVRYAFKDFVIGDLFGLNGFPVSSFRTDNWN